MCSHPPQFVTADILEGDDRSFGVKWCRKCGAYRRFFKNYLNHELLDDIKEWREPEGERCVACVET
jgi:hypothetical protein